MRRPTNAERQTARFVECDTTDHQPDVLHSRRICDPAVRTITCACGAVTWTPTWAEGERPAEGDA